jgi:endonuclease/exonuclease/phosphatase family metal-dependent hydrolase
MNMMRTGYLIFLAALLVIAACGKKGNDDPLIKEPTPPVNSGVIKHGQIVKMMSYNIHHANPPAKGESVIDIPAIAAVINSENPDFVALQEVDKNTKRSGVNLNQAQELGTRTRMNVFFSKSIDYDGGEYGVAVLSKYPIIDRLRHQLPLAEAAAGETRSVAIVSVATEGGNGKVYFGSTHLEVSNSASKKVQAEELLRINSGIQAPFFLAGDFNAIPTDEVISILKQSFTAGCNATCPFTFPATSPSRTIDYILLNQKASAEFVIQSYRTANEAMASDHRAVVAELKYK